MRHGKDVDVDEVTEDTIMIIIRAPITFVTSPCLTPGPDGTAVRHQYYDYWGHYSLIDLPSDSCRGVSI
jgi:hypothetical protein